jgi:Ca2+-binding EF-hand superfamily protein
VTNAEIEELLKKVGNGNKISQTEYLCMMLDLKEFISIRDDFVTGVFRYFDVDGNGLIT